MPISHSIHGDASYVFGFTGEPETRRILNAPDGARVRIRSRKRCFTQAFIRTESGIQQGYLRAVEGGLWFTPRAMNQTRKASP